MKKVKIITIILLMFGLLIFFKTTPVKGGGCSQMEYVDMLEPGETMGFMIDPYAGTNPFVKDYRSMTIFWRVMTGPPFWGDNQTVDVFFGDSDDRKIWIDSNYSKSDAEYVNVTSSDGCESYSSGENYSTYLTISNYYGDETAIIGYGHNISDVVVPGYDTILICLFALSAIIVVIKYNLKQKKKAQ